jgi:hypothetical protein
MKTNLALCTSQCAITGVGALFTAFIALAPCSAPAAVTTAWVQRYQGIAVSNNANYASALAVDRDGNVAVTGRSLDSSARNYDYYTAKYAAADGALLWERRFNGAGSGEDVATAVAMDSSGNVVVTGYSYIDSFVEFYTAKYAAANGSLLWEQSYEFLGVDVSTALALDSSGNVIVTGYALYITDYDFYTIKYAAENGGVLWEKRYRGADDEDNSPRALAVDGLGDVIVAGNSQQRSSGTRDYQVVKYAAADGALLWQARYHGPGNLDNYLTGMALDSNGNVAVTGYSYSGNGSPDFLTAKYAAGNGALIWQQRFNGSPSQPDLPQAVAVDSSGNVIVTGSSARGYYDIYTIKYAAADGMVLWEQRYNGPSDRHDWAQAIAVDTSGNAYVTGYSEVTSSVANYVTTKYDAQGNQLWQVRYDHSASYDIPAAIGLDSAANIFVTGTSDNNYATIKYVQTAQPGFPSIITEPRSKTVLAGSNVVFSVAATGTPPLSYQWAFNGSGLPGATNQTLVLTNAQSLQSGDYSILVSNSVGVIATPLTWLSIISPPLPISQSAFVGDSAGFMAQISGNGPFGYQWLFNGGPIPKATNATLFLTNLQPAQAGDYSVAVANPYGSVTSGGASLIVYPLETLRITSSPESRTAIVGDTADFKVNFFGRLPPTYQWYFNGQKLTGATNSILTLYNVQLTNAGSYRAVVANQFNAATSAIAQLKVELPGPLELWTASDILTSLPLYGIAYGRGIFVAVGYGGVVLTSGDGMAWTNQTVSANDLHGITYGGGIFVAVGSLGTILTSLDGILWTNRASGTDLYLLEAAYGNGFFVIVGHSGQTLSSSDGMSWTSHEAITDQDLNGITYGGGQFVAVGDGNGNSTDGVIFRSTNNAASWTFEDSYEPKNLRGVTYGQEEFIAVGNDGFIISAIDPEEWSDSALGCTSRNNLRGITCANGTFVAVGNAGTILTSADGTSWRCPNSGTTDNLHNVAYGNGRFVAVGKSGRIVRSGDFLPGRLAVRAAPDNHGFEVTLTGEIGRTYHVQANSNLTTTNWIDLFTFDNLESATTIFLDQNAPNFRQRFYRLVSP